MVKNRIGLVGEYPSGCLADDTMNDITLNSTSAKLCVSFPILLQSAATLMEGLQDLRLVSFKYMQIFSRYG